MNGKKTILLMTSLLVLSFASGCATQGPKGDPGDAGLNGSDGKNGSQIFTGVGAPNNNGGNEGDIYIDTETGDLYTKGSVSWNKAGNLKGRDGTNGAQGPQGAKGDIGETGPQGEKGDSGKDGSSVLLGKGKPSSDLGSIGDSYIDTDTFDFYSKDGNGWKKTGNLKGDKGGSGAQGEQGPKGDKGDKGDPGKDGITYVPCIFQNWDGSKLFEFYYERGSTVVYTGPTPTKQTQGDDGEIINWTFTGWDKSLENIQNPTIFTAQFECVYDCKFVNYDGSLLYETKVNRGENATYVGETPTKESEKLGTITINYVFKGWDQPLTNIKKDMKFTALFDAPTVYECTFLNYDGTLLGKQYCFDGDNVSYNGTIPTKAQENDGNGNITKYEFYGWDKSLKNIKGDTVFTAQFSTTLCFECRFVNYDGSLLYKTDVFKGGTVKYAGETPERDQNVDGTTVTSYSFFGWDKDLTDIQAPITFTAKYYENTFTGYKVTFKSEEGTILYSHYYRSGRMAVYPYEQPFSYDSANVHLFVGWSESLSNLSKEMTVTAHMKTISRRQNGEYPQAKVMDDALIAKLAQTNESDSQGYISLDGERYFKRDRTFYKVEPIQWRKIENSAGKVYFLSEKLLDSKPFNLTESNNYKSSYIRKWLNSDFIDRVFSDDSLITTMEIDNSAESTGSPNNPNVCEDTNDKVSLLSVQELVNDEFFESDANGYGPMICYGTNFCNGEQPDSYWTRSPAFDNSEYADYICCSINNDEVGVSGSSQYVKAATGVRPIIRFDFSQN